MQPFLPQQDPHPSERRRTLQQRQATVQYDHGLIAPLGLVKQVPAWHQPSKGLVEARRGEGPGPAPKRHCRASGYAHLLLRHRG